MYPSYFHKAIRKTLPLLFCMAFALSCTQKNKLVKIDPAFAQYIESNTSGVVSKKSSIIIKLAGDVVLAHSLLEPVKEELFSFSPSVKGTAYWTDQRTIEFKPAEELEPDQLYTISFKLGKLIDVPSKFKDFTFNVQIIKPAFLVEESGLKSYGKDSMSLKGVLTTSDQEAAAKVEQLLAAKYNGQSMKVNWEHNDARQTHYFTVAGIKRQSAEKELQLQWNGKSINAKQNGNKVIAIPAIGDFKVLGVRVVQDDEQYTLIQFSDPLQQQQSLDGLVSLSEQEQASFMISDNEVRIYAASALEGNFTVQVNEGIRNAWETRLPKSTVANVFFENRQPSISMNANGVVLPSSDTRLLMPFEATNLMAVDVSIIKVYENNVPSFLRTNNLAGSDMLREVAAPMAEGTLRLDADASLDLRKKNKFLLDISQYIKTEPGAIYRVKLSFRPSYSLFNCTDNSNMNEKSDRNYDDYYEDYDDNTAFWNRYYAYYPYGYDWEQHNNPCHRSYYNGERFVSRNVIASNMGLVAKRGGDNNVFVSVNDLQSTDAVSGVELTVLDYQQQIVGKGTSGSDGMTVINAKRKPFLLIARKGSERNYLRLDEGSALPLSKFDISGTEVKKGIKGFIFGERGVWRPGDSLFLSCMIEDKTASLPVGHPIELELYTPQGQLYKKLIQPLNESGLIVYRTATDASSPTGTWNCRVKVGSAIFDKRIKIETVMPNRIKIALDLGATPSLGQNAPQQATLQANWLFGAVAQNLKARVDAQLYGNPTPFPAFPDYTFNDPSIRFTPQSLTVFDGKLNAAGTAAVNTHLKLDGESGVPGVLLANLSVKVFEPGGNFSIDNISLPYHAYSSYAGLKLPKGDEYSGVLNGNASHTFQFLDVTTEGKTMTGSSSVEMSLYKLQWRWWWDDGANEIGNFSQDSYNKLIRRENITLNNGKGSYSYKFKDGEGGRYLMLVKDLRSNHITGKVFFVEDDDYLRMNKDGEHDAATMLSFTSDKTKYNSGDRVNLTIPSSEGGKAIISIENGTKVLKTFQVKTTKDKTRFSFTAEKDMAPNVYVHITMIQPHAQTVNDLPIRMYGVLPVIIENKETILTPVIRVKEQIRPEETNTITISEAKRRKMTYVIAIVDEGLLDLTRFKTPDPHGSFFAREALGVKSWDLYDHVIGAWGAELQRILTIGGDADAELAAKTRRANRFKPVVKFMGPFTSNGGEQQHSFSLPPYMGSARVMVIAAHEGSYGKAEKNIAVKKPLMLLASMPRILAPSEDITIPVTVFATSNTVKKATLSLDAGNYLQGNGEQTVNFTGNGEQVVYFKAKVKQQTGIAKIRVKGRSGNETDVHEIEIDVRNPNPVITQTTEATLQPGQSWSGNINAIGNGASSTTTLELSSTPAIDLQKRLSYLIQYPHGCIEQTTSAAFPQLMLPYLTDLNQQRKTAIAANIRNGIQKIQHFQTGTGGFAYWPGSNTDDEWGTNYAGHFLLEAQRAGYAIPGNVLQQWTRYQRKQAQSWNVTVAPSYGSDLTQAYRLYLLSLNKAPELGAMNKLREYKFLSTEARWRLAAAYYVAGQENIALQLISGLSTSFPERTSWGISYGSSLRDEAMVLETLAMMNRRQQAEQLVRKVAAKLSQDQWYSTQTTAYSLLAIARYGMQNKSDEVRVKANLQLNGNNTAIQSNSILTQTNVERKSGKANMVITNNSKQVLYVRVLNSGQPFSTQIVPVVNNPAILDIRATYMNTAGEQIDPAKIKQGTDFVAKVTVRNPGNRSAYAQMALTQYFPGGWEILNTRLFNTEGAFKSSESDYMDIRDDKVQHYFNLAPGETKTYYVQLNAAYLGRYFWPGVYAEAMYDQRISGGITAKWVEVTE
jgi:uncharacterized protein YfaS (alpha-2-macroglobulin family)